MIERYLFGIDFDPRDVRYRCISCNTTFAHREFKKHTWRKHRTSGANSMGIVREETAEEKKGKWR